MDKTILKESAQIFAVYLQGFAFLAIKQLNEATMFKKVHLLKLDIIVTISM